MYDLTYNNNRLGCIAKAIYILRINKNEFVGGVGGGYRIDEIVKRITARYGIGVLGITRGRFLGETRFFKRGGKR